jgi:hypothetical protein
VCGEEFLVLHACVKCDAANPVGARLEAVVRKIIGDEHEYEKKAAYADGKSDDINCSVPFLAGNVSQSDDKIVFQHDGFISIIAKQIVL